MPLAEREGFEPSVRLRVRSISNAVHSAALSPLQASSICKKTDALFKFKTWECDWLFGLEIRLVKKLTKLDMKPHPIGISGDNNPY